MRYAIDPLRLTLFVTAAFALGGCSENIVGARPDRARPDAGPPMDAGEGVDGGEPTGNAYPEGPYGAFLGDTIANFRFDGYVTDDPSAGAVSDGPYVEGFTFQDIRELGRFDYLLINVAAEWCQGCRVEATQIPGLYETWAPRGGYVLSIITEDVAGRPATKRHLDSWLASFSINYSMVHDPQEFVNGDLGPESLPMNMIIDLRTMEIRNRVIGEDLTVFETFEALLQGD